MDVAIKEVGATLLIGLFTVLTADAFAVYLLGRRLIGFFDKKLGFDDNVKTKTTLLLAVSFAGGLLAEDISYKFVDDETNPVVATSSSAAAAGEWIKKIVTGEKADPLASHRAISRRDFRFHTLSVHRLNPAASVHEITPTALGSEIGALNLFTTSGVTFGDLDPRVVDGWFAAGQASSISAACVRSVEIAVERLYYQAKNTVFLQQTLFQEMTRIETRLDFARSISLIAYTFLVCAQALFVGRLIEILLGLTRRALPPIFSLILYAGSVALFAGLIWFRGPGSEDTIVLGMGVVVAATLCVASMGALKNRRLAVCQASLLILTLFGFYVSGVAAYWREQEEFDKRAFGYYVTLASHDPPSKPRTSSQPFSSVPLAVVGRGCLPGSSTLVEREKANTSGIDSPVK
jgi:hypothetical protein